MPTLTPRLSPLSADCRDVDIKLSLQEFSAGGDAHVKELQQQLVTYRAEQDMLQTAIYDLRAEVSLKIESLQLELRGANTVNVVSENTEVRTNQSSIKEVRGANTVNIVSQNTEVGTSHSSINGSLTMGNPSTPACWLSEFVASDGLNTWAFGNSCWDAAAFLGNFEVVMLMESLGITFLLLTCITIQVCFSFIVWNGLGHSSFDDETLQGYHWWRTNIGHSAHFVDPLTTESLVSRVCRADSSLHLSQGLSDQIAHINSFLDENRPFNGPLMCLLAIITWTLTVFKEFRGLFDKALGLAELPVGKTVVCLVSDNGLEVRSVSGARFFYLVFLLLARAFIAGWLLIAGGKYLVTTLSIEDVLLNAVALEFVLNADELLYETLVPTKIQQFISLLRPIQATRVKICGLDVLDFFRTAATVIAVVVAYHFGLIPELAKMKEARWELCHGEQAFSYSVSAGGFVQWAETLSNSSHQQKLYNLEMSSRYGLLRGLIEGSHSEMIDVFHLQPSALQKSLSQTIKDVGERYNAKCADKLTSSFHEFAGPEAQTMALFGLRDAIGNQSISTCYDVERYCNVYQEQRGISARLFCPQTCGCQSPQSALIYSSPAQGCPSSCSSQASYLQALESTPCVDLTRDDSKSLLVTYALNYQVAVSFKPRPLRERVMPLTELLLLHGCEAEGIEYLCSLADLKSLSFFCPVRCRCNETKHDLCPLSC